ncbi:Probable ATP phosphoribosyltransferase [Mycobacteroides abscessus]|nr:Probable ATP phosphoribosyltransferase [Mycobacteroides abscessus]
MALQVLVYSDDITVRRKVIQGIGARPDSALPPLEFVEVATGPMVIERLAAVEISIQLGVADVIADIVGTGRTLRQHGLVAFGESLCDSEAVLIERENADPATESARTQLTTRIQGVVFGQQYLMLDYDCPRAVLDEALKVTPGLESPTLAPLADEAWVAVRALAPRKGVNTTMDALAAIGAKAILASEVRFFRA